MCCPAFLKVAYLVGGADTESFQRQDHGTNTHVRRRRRANVSTPAVKCFRKREHSQTAPSGFSSSSPNSGKTLSSYSALRSSGMESFIEDTPNSIVCQIVSFLRNQMRTLRESNFWTADK